MKTILLTGGAGYIGSHTAVELIKSGYRVIVADNLSNSSETVLDRIEQITSTRPAFYKTDLTSSKELENIFREQTIDSVVHFAGLKSVEESIEHPLRYYRVNINSSLNLMSLMSKYGVKKLVFSSSATVYGDPKELPLTEESPTGTGITNPYGWSKFMIEKIIEGYSNSNPGFEATVLRYFNPIGAHESGLIGEDPRGVPPNLVPYVAQVASGVRDKVRVWGNDYDTPDGTGVRDYIHVVDLAKGHVAALNKSSSGLHTYNLGTGKGYSVLEVIEAFSKVCGHEIPYELKPRRSGDIASCYSSASKAEHELGWKTAKSLDDMCRDVWNWQKNNPYGYDS